MPLDKEYYDKFVNFLDKTIKEVFCEEIENISKEYHIQYLGAFKVIYKYLPSNFTIIVENEIRTFDIIILDHEGLLRKEKRFSTVLPIIPPWSFSFCPPRANKENAQRNEIERKPLVICLFHRREKEPDRQVSAHRRRQHPEEDGQPCDARAADRGFDSLRKRRAADDGNAHQKAEIRVIFAVDA